MKATDHSQAEQPSRRPAVATNHQTRPATQTTFADNRPAFIAQRRLADAINTSPFVVAQREQLTSMFGAAAQHRTVTQSPPAQSASRQSVGGAHANDGSNAIDNTQATVQRLIGFEVEYQV